MLWVKAVILQLFEIGSWNFCVAAQYFQLERPLTLGFELSMLDSTPTSQMGFLTVRAAVVTVTSQHDSASKL